ncbi:Antigen -like protein [Toxocara canis]|uniref:Tetraspanin n=1 Tax=Toxocara canis TaxID=6265 RepID=A0A0B2V6T5_TOXCA|nr:Antigen -like protein [Toxocara canis]
MSRNRRPDIDDDSCCGLRLLKIIIYFFNFLFYISGMALIGIGVWTIFYRWEYVALLASSNYKVIAYLAICIGFVVIVVATFGCICVAKSRAMLVLAYTLLLLFVLILESVLCVFSFSYCEQIGTELNSSLMTNLIRDHSVDIRISKALETLHKEGKCCGALTFEDWRNSVWWQNMNTAALSESRGFDVAVPDFCCRTPTNECGRRDHPSNIYYDGCLRYLTSHMKEHLAIISGSAFAIGIIQLIGTSFATCLFVKLRDFSEPRLRNMRSSRYHSYN